MRFEQIYIAGLFELSISNSHICSSFSLRMLECVASFPYVKNFNYVYVTFCWYFCFPLDYQSFCQPCFISSFERIIIIIIISFWHVCMKRFRTSLEQLLVLWYSDFVLLLLFFCPKAGCNSTISVSGLNYH
jgi:hypothetical protein